MLPSAAMIGVLLLLLAGIGVAAYGERSARVQAAHETKVQAATLAASLRTVLEFGDVGIVRENVRALVEHPRIEAAAVYDAEGRLIAQSAGPGVRVPGAAPAQPAADGGPPAAVAPILSNDQRVGTVYVRSSVEPLAQRIARQGGAALLLLMGALVAIVAGIGHTALRRSNDELAEINDRLRVEMAERAKTEEALRQAQKLQAIGQLTGGLAHDFNNLLTPIVGGLGMIVPTLEGQRLHGLAENALEAARRGAKLINQLLAFSRTHRLQVSPVALNPLIERLRELLVHTLGPSVEIVLSRDPAVESALCDDNQIENAVLNLAINARDAMEGTGRLTITTRATIVTGGELKPGRYVELALSDTGAGMPPDVLARATEPFYTTKPVGQGTGLGLAQVYGIAQQFGGTLRIESTVGEGTTVRILLPAADHAESPSGAPPGAGAAHGDSRVAGAKILVVDDDDDVRAFLIASLEALGATVLPASSGEAGLARLAEGVDLMLLDFAMPGMNGAEVAAAVHARRPGLPILFVTGHADIAAIEAAAGPDAPVLYKPFAPEKLAEAVQRHLPAPTRLTTTQHV
jgi:signal transduction histidine kinase/ActR/RegA family two-component response regulator